MSKRKKQKAVSVKDKRSLMKAMKRLKDHHMIHVTYWPSGIVASISEYNIGDEINGAVYVRLL